MNIYEEAIKILNTFRNAYYNYIEDEEKKNVAQALNVLLPLIIKNDNRSKKVEELLKWYQEKDRYFLNRSYYFDKPIEKLEKELEELK